MKKLGIIQVILSGICFGFLGLFGKNAYQLGISSGELLALRYSMAAIMLFFYLLIKDPKAIRLNLKDTFISIGLGVFGYALFSSLFFYALTGLTASLTVLLLYTYPIMVTILSRFLLGEKLNSQKIISLILVTIGMYFLVFTGEIKINGWQYLLAGIGAAFFYSLYIIYSRKYLERVPPFTSSFYVQVGAGLVLSLIHFHSISRPMYILSEHFLLIMLMAFICSFLAMSLFLSGLQKITSTETSILSTTEPISGVIIAIVFLHERLVALQGLGAILILMGLLLIGLNHKLQKSN